MEPGPVRDDWFPADDPMGPEIADRRPIGVQEVIEARRLEDQPLDQWLEAENLLDSAGCDFPELIERVRRVGPGAGIEQPRPAIRPLLARPAPRAPVRTSSRSSSSRASVAGRGNRRMFRPSRSASVRLPGSSLTGSPGSSPRSIPSSAAAITPPSATYGFALESLAFNSR